MNIKFKNIITILIISAFVFLFSTIKVKADDLTKYQPNCVSQGKCIVMCGYENRVQTNGFLKESVRFIYIFYRTDISKWQIQYVEYTIDEKTGEHLGVEIRQTLADTSLPREIDGNPYIYYQSENLINNLTENGVCPKVAFLDTNAKKEICFGDTATYCTDDNPGGGGAIFKGDVYFPLEYFSKLKRNVDAYFNQGFDCEQIYKMDNPEKVLANQLNTFFESGDQLAFIKKYKDKTLERMNQTISTCNAEQEAKFDEDENKCIIDFNKGIISQEEYDECMGIVTEAKAEYERKKAAIIEALNSFTYSDAGIGEKITCAEILGANLVELIRVGYNIAKIGVAILVVVLSMMDFLSATSSPDPDKKMKEAFGKAIKRLILIIVMFILPLIISLIGLIWPSLDLSCLPK